MQFSVSATNRPPRQGETDGVNYHFLSDSQFQQAISNGDFVEYEEVYPGRFYGTLKSEVEKRCSEGHNVILDIDVKGGVNVKEMFGQRAISIFIMPPSIEALRNRLVNRGTDTTEAIAQRVGKAQFELEFAPRYDKTIINDNLQEAIQATGNAIKEFVGK